MKCGDILLVDYPFTDTSGSKLRPALVVSAERYNQGDDVVVVPVSSVPAPDDPYAFLLDDAGPSFEQTGLRRSSSVRWTKPLTISRRVVRRRLGYLPSGPLSEIQSKLRTLFQS